MSRRPTARETKLWRSAALRSAIGVALLYTLGAGLAFWGTHQASVAFMRDQVRETLDAEIEGLREHFELFGLDGVVAVIETRIVGAPNRESLYLLTDPFGRFVIGNISRPPSAEADASGEVAFTLRAPAERAAIARRYVLTADRGGAPYELWIGREIETLARLEQRLWTFAALGVLATAALACAAGLLFARRVLGRLQAINATAGEIMAGDLSRRVARRAAGDEFDELACNLNAMLARIEALMTAMRQVTDHIAHDLRTPLTRLRARAERAAADSADPAAAEALARCVHDADGLLRTFDALLQIARIEAGAPKANWGPVDLGAIATDVVDLYEPAASEQGASLEARVAADVPPIAGNAQLLAQALANLVDNALKHGKPDGQIRVEVAAEGAGAGIAVIDDGPGVPPARREEALARFGRLEAERSTPGAGLGLDLVRAIVELHEGSLSLDDARPGLAVSLRFT